MELIIDDFSKSFNQKKIFCNFTYTFHNNEIYLLIGKNGVGKSTLLKCIATLHLSDTGRISFQHVDIKSVKQYREYRKHVSLFVEADKSLHSNLTVLQNIKFFLGINNISYKKSKKEIWELLKKFELQDFANKKVAELSKGMKQKVALIIAFLKQKDIILLDEPYDGLDATAVNVLNHLLQTYSKEKIIIITAPRIMESVATKIINL